MPEYNYDNEPDCDEWRYGTADSAEQFEKAKTATLKERLPIIDDKKVGKYLDWFFGDDEGEVVLSADDDCPECGEWVMCNCFDDDGLDDLYDGTTKVG